MPHGAGNHGHGVVGDEVPFWRHHELSDDFAFLTNAPGLMGEDVGFLPQSIKMPFKRDFLTKNKYIKKEGNWKTRWFVLENGVLSWYPDIVSKESEKLGSTQLYGCTVDVGRVALKDGRVRPHIFKLSSSAGDYHFQCMSATARRLWVEALQLSIRLAQPTDEGKKKKKKDDEERQSAHQEMLGRLKQYGRGIQGLWARRPFCPVPLPILQPCVSLMRSVKCMTINVLLGETTQAVLHETQRVRATWRVSYHVMS